MDHLIQKSYALCNIYTSLCANKLPQQSTISAMTAIESLLEDLADNISAQEEAEPKDTSKNDDDIPF